MKKSIIILALIAVFLSNKPATGLSTNKTNIFEQTNSWAYTRGYHSDGTSVSIRYNSNTIEVFYNGNWCETHIYIDNSNNRKYIKTPANKRYYF